MLKLVGADQPPSNMAKGPTAHKRDGNHGDEKDEKAPPEGVKRQAGSCSAGAWAGLFSTIWKSFEATLDYFVFITKTPSHAPSGGRASKFKQRPIKTWLGLSCG